MNLPRTNTAKLVCKKAYLGFCLISDNIQNAPTKNQKSAASFPFSSLTLTNANYREINLVWDTLYIIRQTASARTKTMFFLLATAFRNAKAFEQCKDCLMKAADCHKQSRSLFYAAKALDQAILVCKEMGDLREVPSLAERAANMYQTHGSGDTAVSSLDKAAKILEQQQPQQALGLYLNAANIATVSFIFFLLFYWFYAF